jgi:hypothetical protein
MKVVNTCQMIPRFFNFLTRNGQGSVFFVQLVFFGGKIVDVDATEVRTSGCKQLKLLKYQVEFKGEITG